MSEHTPGPWIVALNIDGVYAGTLSVVKSAVGSEICGPRQIRPQAKELEANANLIAAAPDLLEALKAILTICDSEGMYALESDAARAAIAKAKGE